MSPLELEIYHQMRDVIGIDPAFYEYIFTVDADTARHLMIFYNSLADLSYVFRLLHRTLPIVWLLLVQTTLRLSSMMMKISAILESSLQVFAFLRRLVIGSVGLALSLTGPG
jgi:hypothetical protein